MPFEQLTPRPLTPGGIRIYAPAVPGVYGISNAREWVYIGQSDNIRDALLTYLSDSNPALIAQEPVGFVYETCGGFTRTTRQERLIFEYRPANAASQLTKSGLRRHQ